MQTVKGLAVLLIVATGVFAFGAISDMKSQAKYAAALNNATVAGPVRIAKKLPARAPTNTVNQVRQKTGHANL